MTDDLEEAVALLVRKRGEHEAQIRRIDSALAALTGIAVEAPATDEASSPATAREKAMALLDAENREWSIAEIVDEWERRGDPIRGTDQKSAVRAAMKLAIKKQQAFKSRPGRYRSTKYAPATTTFVFEPPVAMPHRNGNTEEMSGQEAAS